MPTVSLVLQEKRKMEIKTLNITLCISVITIVTTNDTEGRIPGKNVALKPPLHPIVIHTVSVTPSYTKQIRELLT